VIARRRLAAVATCAFAWWPMLRAQDVPPPPPRGSSMFTERAARKAAFRNEPALAAVRAGLGWLVGHQDDKGNWDCDGFMKHDPPGKECDGAGNPAHDVGVTALALLALLAQADPAYLDPTRHAADWLVAAQHGPSGSFRSQTHDQVYAQALATLALTEASALLGEPRYRKAAANGLHCLEAHHNPGKAWRYKPRDGDNDTSVTSWCVAAYGAAAHAGIDVRAESVGEALAWLEGVTTVTTGHCGYTNRGEPSARMPGDHATRFPVEKTEVNTAAAMHLRAIAGLSTASRLNRAAAAVLLRKPPTWKPGAVDLYYWFHGSEAMAALPDRALGQKWFAALQAALVPAQRKDGEFLGSWDATDTWGSEGGRIVSTAFAVLALSSPYRLGPLHVAPLVPDAPPFRRVHSLWKEGKLGAALAILPELKAAATAEQQQVMARVEWFGTVQTTFCNVVVARSKDLYPDAIDRQERLGELAATYSDLAPGQAAAAAQQQLLADPAIRDQIESAKMLRAILDSFDVDGPPKDLVKRRALADRFEKVVKKYPRTPAAEKALEWIRFLR